MSQPIRGRGGHLVFPIDPTTNWIGDVDIMLPVKFCLIPLKLTCHQINRRHICFNIKSISVHPLLWMNVMLDSICMVCAELPSTGYKRKIQNDNRIAEWLERHAGKRGVAGSIPSGGIN